MTPNVAETAHQEAPEATSARRRQAKARPARSEARKPEPKRQTKKQQLIRMLNGKAGADVATISGKLGWQQHTTRAALTHLRKAGYTIAAEKPEGGKPARYRIAAAPEKS